MFSTSLKIGETISSRQLMDIFKCACEGGIRYASKTGVVVIVVNNTKKGLPNIWHGDELEFAGRPLKDGATFTGANKRLNEFLTERRPVFLFEVNKLGAYQYMGPVQLVSETTIARTPEGLAYPVFKLKLMRDLPASSGG